jgi:hypothetical protein
MQQVQNSRPCWLLIHHLLTDLNEKENLKKKRFTLALRIRVKKRVLKEENAIKRK